MGGWGVMVWACVCVGEVEMKGEEGRSGRKGCVVEVKCSTKSSSSETEDEIFCRDGRR